MKLKSVYKAFPSAPKTLMRGFTLIELVMVMVILGILAAISVVDIDSYQTQHLYAVAERIAADLRYAKNLALTSNQWHGVLFSLNPVNSYRLYQTNGVNDVVIKRPEDPTRDYIINLSDEYHNVTLSGLVDMPGGKVEFNPHGVPYNDKNGSPLVWTAMVVLAGEGNGGGGCACAGSSLFSVRIDPQTGRIYIQ